MQQVRILLAQIRTFELQHRAGINPSCSALTDFFETAHAARLELDALDRGLRPPVVSDAAHAAREGDAAMVAATLEGVSASPALARIALVVLEELGRTEARTGA